MWPYPRIIAHRGGGSLAPENTLAAFLCGFQHGFRAVEFDVVLTKDLLPVVLHDEDLGRTVPGQGSVAEILAADLLQRDAGSWFSTGHSQVRVPTYVEVLQFCTQHGIWMNVEIKPAHRFEHITGKIVAEVTAHFYQQMSLSPLPLFSSFSPEALAAAQIAAPHIARAALFDRIPADWHAQLVALQAVALHTNQKYLSAGLAQQIKQQGYGLSCYTVNEVARAHELLSWGVDALFTDKLDLIGPDFGELPLIDPNAQF